MTTKKKVILGCSIAAVVAAFGMLLIVGGCIFFLGSDPKGVTVQIQNASTTQKGETIELTVRITNDRASQPFKLSDIDLQDGYVKGFVVVGTEPESKSSTHTPIVNSQSFTFDVSIPAHETREFKFKLRAVETGVFKGDVDIYEGMRSITKMAETEIK